LTSRRLRPCRPLTLPGDATVEITDLLGTRQVPAAPARVVCLDGRNDLELAMLCEWPVVGYYDRSTETVPYPADLVAAVADADSLPFEPNLEQLAALRPDLIILVDEYWVDEIGRDGLEAIAPLLVTIHDPDLGGHFGDFQTALTDAELLAAENLGEVDADCIIRSSYTLEAGAFEALEANPLWAAMPAVQRGAVIDTAPLVVNFGGPVLALACLELLDRAYELAAVTAGDS
jgi:ABC-type Fe3+-hydroxamate transport system substrate-binding protein